MAHIDLKPYKATACKSGAYISIENWSNTSFHDDGQQIYLLVANNRRTYPAIEADMVLKNGDMGLLSKYIYFTVPIGISSEYAVYYI